MATQELQNPADKYPKPPYKKQSQPWPGLASKMDPRPDHGEKSYRGSGRLAGGKALITGAIPAWAARRPLLAKQLAPKGIRVNAVAPGPDLDPAPGFRWRDDGKTRAVRGPDTDGSRRPTGRAWLDLCSACCSGRQLCHGPSLWCRRGIRSAVDTTPGQFPGDYWPSPAAVPLKKDDDWINPAQVLQINDVIEDA
jgi:hypothetical protein